jgi:hypothetical protein
MANKQKLEQKLGEVLGLEMAAQKAVEELSAKGLLDEAGVKTQVEGLYHDIKLTKSIATLRGLVISFNGLVLPSYMLGLRPLNSKTIVP